MASSTKTSTGRWCLICNRQLITCKRYMSIDTASARLRKDPAFVIKLTNIVGETIDVDEPHMSKNLCEQCDHKLNKVEKNAKLREEIKRDFCVTKSKHEGKTTAGTSYTSVLKKRKAVSSPGTPSTRKPLKKRLNCGQPSSAGSVKGEVTIHYPNHTQTREISGPWLPVVVALCEGRHTAAVRHVVRMEQCRDEVKRCVVNCVTKEVNDLCDTQRPSLFRGSTKTDLEQFNFKLQHQELQERAPYMSSILHAVAAKTSDTTPEMLHIPGITTAASVLLNCRTRDMNAHQVLNSLILKESGAKKAAFRSLNSTNICTSYDTVLRRQINFGMDYDKEVKQWAKAKCEADSKERELINSETAEELEEFQKQRKDSGYQLVMDNVDLIIHARHTSRAKFGSDLHMAQVIAVKNRVSGLHLPNDKPSSLIKDVDISKFVPTVTDNRLLKQEWVILIGKIISKNIPALQWFASHLPNEVPHAHIAEMKQKSQVVNLGVLMENENSSDGIYAIMHYMHQYVPGHDSESVTPIISAGDLLTCERESSSKSEQRNSRTPSQRLEGIVPVIADFHALANFYQVLWFHLYDTTSSGDIGTLYSARNYLEARMVTSDPIKNINAASDLITDYTVALVLAASMRHFGLEKLSEAPTQNDFKFAKHQDRTQYVNKVLEDLIDKFIIPSNDDLKKDSPVLSCPSCPKTYKTKKGLKSHMKKKHPGIQEPKRHHCTLPADKDALFNYTRTALSLSMLAYDFNDARKIGDGDRIMRVYKFMLLHFKASKKPKYSFHVLRLLAQVHCFLTPRLSYELKWNRFINNSGQSKQNIEVDREIEHQNRVFKDNCRGLRGKVTAKSINRISRSAQQTNKLITAVNKQTQVRKASGKHKRKNTCDALTLALEFHKERIFDVQPGRRHFHFADFPVSVLSGINAKDLHTWIKSSLKHMSREHRLLTK